MADLAIFGLLFAAIAIGWVLGRRHSRSLQLSRHYFTERRGEPSPNSDSLSSAAGDALVVDGGSTQNRIAMGVQLRRQGEVDGAVRIHEDLLARPSLPPDDVVRARLELARDYISAGLLDRAEELLLELVQDYPRQSNTARRHLLEVYEIERDWRRAIEVAKTLLPRTLQRRKRIQSAPLEQGQRAALRLAHYCCELANEERISGDLEAARKLLEDALASDKQCVRASILLGQVEYEDRRYRQAVQALRRVQVQDAAYLPETIGLLRSCYAALDETHVLQEYLAGCLATHPTPTLVAAVAEDMVEAEGRAAAGAFLAEQLVEYPSLPGLAQLIGLQRVAAEGKSREDLAVLQSLTQRLVASRPIYRCAQCGFAGKYLHWHCPGCKHWGSIKANDGPGAH